MLWSHRPAPFLLITILRHNSFCNALCGILLLTSLYFEKKHISCNSLFFLLFNWDLILNMTLLFMLWLFAPFTASSEAVCQKPFEIASNLHPPHPLYPLFYEPLQQSLEGKGARLTLARSLLVSFRQLIFIYMQYFSVHNCSLPICLPMSEVTPPKWPLQTGCHMLAVRAIASRNWVQISERRTWKKSWLRYSRSSESCLSKVYMSENKFWFIHLCLSRDRHCLWAVVWWMPVGFWWV